MLHPAGPNEDQERKQIGYILRACHVTISEHVRVIVFLAAYSSEKKSAQYFKSRWTLWGGQDVFRCLLHHSADAFTSYGIVAFLVKQTAQSTGMGRKSDRSFAEPFWKEKTKQKRPSISPSADRAAFLLLRLCLCARKMTSYITGK